MTDRREPTDHEASGRESSRRTNDRTGAPSRPRRVALARAVERLSAQTAPETGDTRRIRLANLTLAVLGVAVVLTGVVGDPPVAGWHTATIGALVVLASAYNWYRLANDMALSVGVASVVSGLGLWLALTTGLVGPSEPWAVSVAAVGLLVAAIASYAVYRALTSRSIATRDFE